MEHVKRKADSDLEATRQALAEANDATAMEEQARADVEKVTLLHQHLLLAKVKSIDQ